MVWEEQPLDGFHTPKVTQDEDGTIATWHPVTGERMELRPENIDGAVLSWPGTKRGNITPPRARC